MNRMTWKELYDQSTDDERASFVIDALKRIEKRKSDQALKEIAEAWPHIPLWKRKLLRLQAAFFVFSARLRAWKNKLAKRNALAVLRFLAWSEGQRGQAARLEILRGALLYFHFRFMKAVRLAQVNKTPRL
jgi:hypothetical protein